MPYYDSRLNWIHDPAPPPSRHLEQTDTVPRIGSGANSRNSVPRNNSVLRNILDPIPSASRGNIPSASRGNIPSASRNNENSRVPRPDNSVSSHSRSVPKRKNNENKMSATATHQPLVVPLSPAPPKKCRIRRRRQAQRAANRNSGIVPATPLTQDERWANQRAAVPAGVTQPLPENRDPTSARRTAVYPPSPIVGNSLTNENSPFQIGLESSRFPGRSRPAAGYSSCNLTSEELRLRILHSPSLAAKGWNCLPIAAACPSPRHQRYRGCRPS